jgi:tripartite-type tricarboxylate transporter receptor subunit TctC
MNAFKRFSVMLACLLAGHRRGSRPDLYPAKPVNLMVPYPAGGPSDAIARIFNVPLGKELGQQVIVENLGGVSGALAAQKVLSAPADGYYLFQGTANEVILSPLANAAVKLTTEELPSRAPRGRMR